MDGAAPADFRHHRPVGSAERCPLAQHHGPASARRWGGFQAGRVCVVCPRYGIEHMFDTIDESTDEILSELEALEGEVAAVRARQVLAIRRLFRAGMTVSAAWLAGRLDVSYRTARDLLEAAARTPEQSVAMARFGSGAMSFDRVTAVAYLVGAGADEATVGEAEGRDIAGVYRLGALVRRISRRTEHQAHQQRSVRSWVSLDESTGFIHAQLAGYDWRVVTKALDDRADTLPNGESTAEQRRADALVAIAQDWLEDTTLPGERPGGGAMVTVMVDAALAAATHAEAGVVIPGGPRVGPETLDRILCEGSVEVLVDQGSGVPLAVGPTTRVIPPRLRRFVLARDGGCVIDGCASRYRLEVHHIVPRSQGGGHDPDNLVTLCWWHHHVAIHGQGMRIDPNSPPCRRQLVATTTARPPP